MTTHPAKHNLYIYRGATLSEAVTWKDENGVPIDLTGFTARMHMREDQAIFAGIISFYFGQRAMAKLRGGK